MNIDFVFTFTNNNKILSEKPSNLAGCSRLLREFEKQRDNSLNQNVELEVVTNNMDTDEIMERTGDIDSGIENMETDDCTPAAAAAVANQSETSVTKPLDTLAMPVVTKPDRTNEAEICLSRILNAFWADHCEGHIIVQEAALAHKEMSMNMDAFSISDYDDLVSGALIEIFMQYFDGTRIDLKKTQSDHSMTTKTADSKKPLSSFADASTSEQLSTEQASCSSSPTMKPFNPSDQAIIKFLIGCYDRCNGEASNYSDPRRIKEYGQYILELIERTKQQIVQYSVLVLDRTIKLPANRTVSPQNKYRERSPLVDLLYDSDIPSDYLQMIVSEAHKNQASMQQIFGTLVNNLFTDMQSKIIGPRINVMAIQALNELFNVTLLQEPSVRPICNLVGKLYNFYPSMVTSMPGREITKTSFLGPFLSVSVFFEENPQLVDDEIKTSSVELDRNSVGLQSVSKYSRL